MLFTKCFSDLVSVIAGSSSPLVFSIFGATIGDSGIYICAATTAFTLPGSDIPVFIRANVTVIGKSFAHTGFSITYIVPINTYNHFSRYYTKFDSYY